jgi:SAM-dependent methyltransferase
VDADHLAAELYDYTVVDWPGEIAFYRGLARSASSLLEVGCGTGRVTLQLARQGLDVLGFDKSPQMLEVAQRKSGALPNVRWVEADMRSFDLRQKFDLVIIPGHSFQFMLSIADQLSCLRSVRRHLAPNGTLAVHVNNDDLQWLAEVSANQEPPLDPPFEVHLPDKRSFHISKHWTYDTATQTASAATRFDEIDPEGSVISSSIRGPVLLHCFFRFELEHLFQRAWFEVEALYGDFSPSGFTNHSPEMIWLTKVINEPSPSEGTAAYQLAAADSAGVRKVDGLLPAGMRENGWTAARAAGRLSSRPLGGASAERSREGKP